MDNLFNNLVKFRKYWVTSAAILVLLLLGFAVYFVMFASPNRSDAQVVRFDNPPAINGKVPIEGSGIDKLKGEGWIKNTLGFKIAFALKGGKQIEAGSYQLSRSMNAWQMAEIFAKGPSLKWVTIPEGLRKEEIADILATAFKWDTDTKDKWISTYTAMKFDYLEGVYFPDTYFIPVTETPLEIAERLRRNFEEKFSPYAKEALNQNVQWPTVVKIASIVQREAGGNNDMQLIAGIIWNRLDRDMKLEVDATIQYARGKTEQGWWSSIKPEDKQINSPYNTYLNKGLPPHPISNPGIEAIKSVLHPEKTDCLYYLHDSSRVIHCAKTYEEHQANIRNYLQISN